VLDGMEVNGELHVPPALHAGIKPAVPLDRWLNEPQSRRGHGDEKKDSHPLSEIGPPFVQSII